MFGTTGSLTTVALDAPDLAAQLIGEARWPLEIKLHGDFRSRRLKNTPDELRHQWDTAPAETRRLARALTTDLAQLSAEEFMRRWRRWGA